jgi:transcription termination factor Rho
MSDGQGFDLSLLEGKDRAELAAIAESLGQKPGARAKKSDIVELIAKLVGAEGAGSPAAEAAPEDDAPPAASTDGAATNGDGQSDEPTDGGDDAADGGDGADAAPTSGPQGRADRGRDRNGRSEGARGDGQRTAGDAPRGNDADGDASDDGNQADGNRADGNQADGSPADGQGDDLEPGNRRRRRRGRDRDRRNEGDEQAQAEPVEVEGMVELREEGYGFLRLHGYLPSRDDAYVSVKQTRQFGLRTGDIVRGRSRPANRNERNPALIQVEAVNGHPAHTQPPRRRFDELTPTFANERLRLELADDPSNLTVRMVDLLAPIGKGTRGIVASPPKGGKTHTLKSIVRAVEVNHPDVEVLVVLVDERPEEVTDLTRWMLRGTVVASTFDRPAEEHTAVAELAVERAKRLAEEGRDVLVVLDGLTRLARAYNHTVAASGRVLPGGMEPAALHQTKRLVSAARKLEEGGSLTVLATLQVDTGSAADDEVVDALTGTANMELKLDGSLAERRRFPSVDVDRSSSRHEELLFDRGQLAQVVALRRLLADRLEETGSGTAGLAALVELLERHPTNDALLASLPTT